MIENRIIHAGILIIRAELSERKDPNEKQNIEIKTFWRKVLSGTQKTELGGLHEWQFQELHNFKNDHQSHQKAMNKLISGENKQL